MRDPYFSIREKRDVPVLSSLVKALEIRHIQAVILRLLIWSGLLFLVFASPAAPVKLDFLKVGTKVYSNVTIIGANATDLYFTHNQGITNVKLRSVDENLRKRFNFDPQVAAQAERQQAEDDAAYMRSLASNIVARAQKAVIEHFAGQ